MLTESPFEQLKAYYTFLLPAITEESWQKVESTLKPRIVKKGDYIQKAGSPADHVFFVNKGITRKYYDIDGKEKTICFFNENCYVGDYRSFLTRKPAQINTQAITDVELVATSYEGLQWLYRECPEANMLGRIIAENLFIKMSEDAETDLKATIGQRYNLLVKEQPWLLQNVPQYMIASYLGVTPEALSRVKARLKKARPAGVLAS